MNIFAVLAIMVIDWDINHDSYSISGRNTDMIESDYKYDPE